jgi:hypothetical protein
MSLNGKEIQFGILFIEVLLLDAETEMSNVCFPSVWNNLRLEDCQKEYDLRKREADFLRKLLNHLETLQDNDINQ